MTRDIIVDGVSIGPVSTLPGHRHPVPDGGMCDRHPDRPAVAHIQGETDSFGCETHLVCKECLDEDRAQEAEARLGKCDWCKAEATDLRDTRDYEEGLYGPVYRVCGPCIKRRDDEIQSELEQNDAEFDYGDDY